MTNNEKSLIIQHQPDSKDPDYKEETIVYGSNDFDEARTEYFKLVNDGIPIELIEVHQYGCPNIPEDNERTYGWSYVFEDNKED